MSLGSCLPGTGANPARARADQAPGTPSGLGRTVDLSSSPHRPHLSLDTASANGYDYLSSQPRATVATRTSLVKSLLAPVLALVPGTRRTSRGRQHDEGIIAPRTPLRGSPLPSPRLSNVSLQGGPAAAAAAGTYSPWAEGSGSGSGSGSYATPLRDGRVSRGPLGGGGPATGDANGGS